MRQSTHHDRLRVEVPRSRYPRYRNGWMGQQVDAVLATARTSGLQTRRETVGTPVPLPAAVELTEYRIVQEALTNVVRHAKARTVTVTLRCLPGLLEVQVDDDGGGAPGPCDTGGYGLIGMRERAAAVVGEVDTGAGPHRGFRVLARLPIRLSDLR